jgi:hypothetical protein
MKKLKLVLGMAAVAGLVAAAAAFATSATDVQANNPQVAGDATSNTTAVFPTNKQNEPSIAVNPTDSSHLVAGSNDEQLQPPCGPGPVRGAAAPANDCSFFPNVGSDGVYTSADGGASWTNRSLLPGFSDNGGSLVSDGDPRIAYGPNPGSDGNFNAERSSDSFVNGARVYYGGLASYASGQANGNQAPELLTVSASDDNGVTWSNPVISAKGNGYKFNDKEDVWADKNPSSPFFGRLYVSWTEFRGSVSTFFGSPVRVAFSDDGGKTWSKERQLSPAQNKNQGVFGRQGSTVRTGPDGTVYVAWQDSVDKSYDQVVAVSHDGGVSFSRPSEIASVSPIQDPTPGANFRTDSFPSLAVDQNTGGVYVTWADLQGGTGLVVVYKGSSGGTGWTKVFTSPSSDGYAFFQGLDVAPNGRVDLAYQALKATSTSTYGTGNASIDSYYASSTNGTTWSGTTKVSSASSDPAASAQNNLERQFWGDYNTLASTNANAFFIYTDSRNGAGCPAVDAYQHGIDGSGAPTAKPAPQSACPSSQFGNTNAYVSKITP